jgi:hypothetical protein
MKVIIYPNGGGINIVVPTGALALEEVAKKDVPAGVPYLVVDREVIPQDREFRGAWEANFDSPDGYGIGYEAWLANQ